MVCFGVVACDLYDPRDLLNACRAKYQRATECEALVAIGLGFGVPANPKSLEMPELREGGWLQVRTERCSTPKHCLHLQIDRPYCMWKGVTCTRAHEQDIVTNLE